MEERVCGGMGVWLWVESGCVGVVSVDVIFSMHGTPPHTHTTGHRVFRDRQRRLVTSLGSGPPGSEAGGSESCLFVEPLAWMAGTVTGVVSGKLHCPKCAARLGSFNWSGERPGGSRGRGRVGVCGCELGEVGGYTGLVGDAGR